MSNPVALVTGATGFIGHHVVHALLRDGWRVRALVRATSKTADLEALGVECVIGDMGAPETLPAAVAGCAAVFHLASLLKVPWKPEFRTVNVEGTRNVAAACAAADPAPVLVVVSSMAAAGPAPGRPRREADAPAPVSIYGRVKRAAEQAAVDAAGHAPLSIVRPPMVFGEHDRGTLALFRAAAKGLHVVPSLRPATVGLIHGADLAQALLVIAQRGERVAAGRPDGHGVYHVAHPAAALRFDALGHALGHALGRRVRALRVPRGVTWCLAALAEAWARLRDRPAPLNLDKYREATAGDWVCDTAKVEGLGFRPAQAVAARLAQTAAWYRAQGWL